MPRKKTDDYGDTVKRKILKLESVENGNKRRIGHDSASESESVNTTAKTAPCGNDNEDDSVDAFGHRPGDLDEDEEVIPNEDLYDHPHKATSKRKKVAESLSEDQEEALAEWFHDNPLFYDQSCRDFKNKSMKEMLLDDKAREFGMSGSDIFLWFKSQRTIYGRLKKKKSRHMLPSLTGRQCWVLSTFGFLASHVLERAERGQPRRTRYTQEEMKIEREEETYQISRSPWCVSWASGVVDEGEGPCITGLASRSNVEEHMNRNHNMTEQVDEGAKGNNSRTAWAQWMIAELMDLHEDLWHSFQKDTFELVMHYKQQNKALCQQPG